MDADAQRSLRRLVIGLVGIVILAGAGAILFSGSDPGARISIFTTRFLGLFIEAVPFLLMGAVVSGLIDSFVSADDIARIVPRQPVLATIAGGLLGFIFPVCECGVVPVVRRLFAKGLPMSVGVTFLLAAPVINPIVLAATFVAFGAGPIFWGRFIITLVVSVAVGLVFALGARPQEVLRPRSLAPIMGGDGKGSPLPSLLELQTARANRRTFGQGLRDALQTATTDFFDMGRYLIMGALLAAAMQTLVSEQTLLALGRGPAVSVIVMQGLAFLLSVCSTVDAFLALAFAGTFTTGSILAFLTFGPMVDIKSTLMFLAVFKRRIVVYLIVLPLLLTLLIGIWVNLNLAL